MKFQFNLYVIGLLVISLCCTNKLKAQNLSELLQQENNLNSIKSIADAYFGEKIQKNHTGKLADDNEYVKYKRFEHYWESRVNPDGSFPDVLKQHKDYMRYQQGGVRKKTRAGNWRNISQTTTLSGYEGMGRLAAVAFHPTDTNIIYVGANKGGIWKTTTGGNSWIPLGDKLPWCSVGNIVVDKVNPSVLYITIGLNENWTHFGLGVYKSTDGGQTWSATSQSGYFTDNIVYYKLIAHPDSNQVLYSAQSDGLWKTMDAGATWVKIRNGLHRDIEFKPFHPNTLYVAGDIQIYKSVNAGATFTAVTTFNSTSTMEIAVTPADSNYVAFATSANFYLSTDGATTPFVLKNNNIDDNDLLLISHLNKNRVYCGYVTNHRSTDAGINWTQITNWYNDGILPAVHADNHYGEINPLLPHVLYVCNDGGLYKFNELTNQWTDLSQGLIITEFYKIALSATDSVFMIGGTQDNGGRKRVAPASWEATNGGDGMEVAINPTNDQTIYTTYWGGTLYRSYDQWDNDVYFEISPDTNKGAWVTPYMLDPNNELALVAGYSDVWRTTDEGSSWTQISTNLTGNINTKLKFLDIAKTNSNVIFTGYNEKLYVTENLGANWVTKQIPDSSGTFEDGTMVMVHPKNENIVYVTKSGYAAKSKVYRSTDKGSTWTNLSYNLPNVPVSCIQIDRYSDSSNVDIYIGTDIGVFYKKDSDMTWQYYGLGLPNTHVSDLEIYYPTGKLRAGTYGRGIWENDIARALTPLVLNENAFLHFDCSLAQNPVSQLLTMSIQSEKSSKLQLRIFDESGRIVQTHSTYATSGHSSFSMDVSSLSQGIYYLELSNDTGSRKSLPFLKK
jgi:photosystem II stability/assembly factor-like uncharacterized protein